MRFVCVLEVLLRTSAFAVIRTVLAAPSPTPDRLGSREMFPGVVGSVFVWRMGCLCVCVWWGGGVVCIV